MIFGLMRLASLLTGLMLSACVRYEYEEEVFLKIDGSGEIYLNGSRELFAALRGVGGSPDPHFVTAESLWRFYDSPTLEVISVRSSRREGRQHFQLRARFDDLSRLSEHPAFAGRRFWLERKNDSELSLTVEIPGGEKVSGVRGLYREGEVAFRFHFPSPVRFHNSPGGVRRGNIVAWEQPLAEHLGGVPLTLAARFDQRTVLAAAVLLFGTAVLLVGAGVGLGLYLVWRLGRRELAAERALSARPESMGTLEGLEGKP